jgi:hypothetical protein
MVVVRTEEEDSICSSAGNQTPRLPAQVVVQGHVRKADESLVGIQEAGFLLGRPGIRILRDQNLDPEEI